MPRVPVLVSAATTVFVLAVTTAASAQTVFDHLACWAIKDTLPRGNARADVVPAAPPFLAAAGCKIKLPAREYCTRAAKENLVPPPAATIGADEPGDYFCYKVVCPRSADLQGAGFASGDQFGRRAVFVRKPQRLCVPATRATPTPTPVPTSTNPTPTVTSTPGGGGHDPGCSFDGTECQGFCSTSGRCVWEPNQQRCVCPPAFDFDCAHSIASCGGGLCFGPQQACRPVPQATFQLCACVSSTATPTPTPLPSP
jgi:hypothetical protein